jgi:hypothetical protein
LTAPLAGGNIAEHAWKGCDVTPIKKNTKKHNYENIYLKLFMFIAYNLLPETFVYLA